MCIYGFLPVGSSIFVETIWEPKAGTFPHSTCIPLVTWCSLPLNVIVFVVGMFWQSKLVLSPLLSLQAPVQLLDPGRVIVLLLPLPLWVSILQGQYPQVLTILCPLQIGFWSFPVPSKVWQPEVNTTLQQSPPSSLTLYLYRCSLRSH